MSAVATLRARTSEAHDRVDAAFSAYSLADPQSYRRFLQAHARALLPAEAVLAGDARLPAWRPRAALLAADLAALDSALPEPLPLPLPIDPLPAAGWGILYVLEGSRLGGRLLAARVPAGLPTAYLGAVHEPGEWRATRDAIDAEAATQGAAWIEQAVAAASACFDLYARSAAASPA